MCFFVLATVAGLSYERVEARALKVTVYLTQKRIPNPFKGSLLNYAKKTHTRRLAESKETDLKERSWNAQVVLAFNAPPKEAEVTLLFYDIHESRKFVESMSVFLSSAEGQKLFVQDIQLARSRFRPNRKMEMVVTVRKQEVGSLKFDVIGQEAKRSGTVNFNDDET